MKTKDSICLCVLLVALDLPVHASKKGAELLIHPVPRSPASRLVPGPAPAYPVPWPATALEHEQPVAADALVRTIPLKSYSFRCRAGSAASMVVEAILRDGTDGVVGVHRRAGAIPKWEVDGWFPNVSSLRAAIESGIKRSVESGLVLRGGLLVPPKETFGHAIVVEHNGAEPGLELILPARTAKVPPPQPPGESPAATLPHATQPGKATAVPASASSGKPTDPPPAPNPQPAAPNAIAPAGPAPAGKASAGFLWGLVFGFGFPAMVRLVRLHAETNRTSLRRRVIDGGFTIMNVTPVVIGGHYSVTNKHDAKGNGFFRLRKP